MNMCHLVVQSQQNWLSVCEMRKDWSLKKNSKRIKILYEYMSSSYAKPTKLAFRMWNKKCVFKEVQKLTGKKTYTVFMLNERLNKKV
jgi:hypothetical protein